MRPLADPIQSDASRSGLTRRQLLGGAAAAATVAGTLTLPGCSGGTDPDRPLQFWQFYAPQAGDGEIKTQNDWFVKAVDDWNRRGGEQVELVFIPNFTDPSNTRLATAFAAGDGPDIFLISPGDFLRYLNGGALFDLAPFMSQEAIDDFDADVLATRRVGDGIYALPMEVEPLAMYYSVPAWEKAGLSEGDIPTTWDQLLNVADKLTSRTRSGLVLETTPGYFQNFVWYSWLWQGGGDVVNAQQKPIFEGRAATEALELFGTAIQQGVAPRTLPAAGDLPSAFVQDYAAMWQSGIWQVSAFRQNYPDFEYGVFQHPLPPGGKPATTLGGWAWCVNAKGRNPEAAAKFVVETIGSMKQESVDRIVDWCTKAKADMPPRKSVDEQMRRDGAYDNDKMALFRNEILSTGRGEPRYPPVVYKAISDAIQRVQVSGAGAAEEAATAQAAIEAFLETYDGGPLL